MRKCAFVIVGLFIVIPRLFAQWGPEVQLSPDPGNTGKIWYAGYSIATDRLKRIHVVWNDDREGNHEIYYRRSMNQGQNWEPEIRLTNNSTGDLFAAIAVDTFGFVHVIYFEGSGFFRTPYYQRSTDGGATWETPVAMTSAYRGGDPPSIAVDKNNGVHVVWTNVASVLGPYRIMYRRSTDRGTTWQTEVIIDSTEDDGYGNTKDPLDPSIATDDNGRVHIMWQEMYYTGALWFYYNYYRRSTDGGATWQTPIDLSVAQNRYIGFPIIATNDQDIVFIAYTDQRAGSANPRDVYLKRSTNGGSSWSSWIQLTNSNLQSESSSFAFFPGGSKVYFTWGEYNVSTNLGTINYKVSTDGGATWSPGDRDLVSSSDSTRFPCVAVFASPSDSSVHFTWIDRRSGTSELYYKRFYNVVGVAEQTSVFTDMIKVFPNPSRADVYFAIPQSTNYSVLKIFDVSGRNIKNLPITNHGKDPILIKWDRKDNFGNSLPAGFYFMHFERENKSIVKTVVLLK